MSDMRMPRPRTTDEFRKRLRAELMNEAVALAEERRLRRRSITARFADWWSAGTLRPIAVTAALGLVLLAGAGSAAAGSLPGEPAFVLKQAAEQVELALAPGDEAKVNVLVAQAQRRLDDLQRASDRPDRSPTASDAYEAAVAKFAAAVEALRVATPETKHDAVEKVVEAARDKHVEVLEELKDRLPAPAQRKIERAIEEHEQLAGPAKPDRPRPSERPGGAPSRPTPAESARPRASETPRGVRPTLLPSPGETHR